MAAWYVIKQQQLAGEGKEKKAVPPTQDVTKTHTKRGVACLSFGDPEPRRFLRRCPPLHGRGGEMKRALEGGMCVATLGILYAMTQHYIQNFTFAIVHGMSHWLLHTPCHTRFRLPAEIRALHSLFDAEAARKIAIAFDLIAAWASIQSCL